MLCLLANQLNWNGELQAKTLSQISRWKHIRMIPEALAGFHIQVLIHECLPSITYTEVQGWDLPQCQKRGKKWGERCQCGLVIFPWCHHTPDKWLWACFSPLMLPTYAIEDNWIWIQDNSEENPAKTTTNCLLKIEKQTAIQQQKQNLYDKQ